MRITPGILAILPPSDPNPQLAHGPAGSSPTRQANLEALGAWHRARGVGVTLVVQSAVWTGIAAVDRSLVTDSTDQDDWSLARLHALAQPRAIEFPGARQIQAALLDRDGTIIEDRGYLSDPDAVSLLPGTAAGLRALASGGMRLLVLTNQSGVGRGRITLQQLDLVHHRLAELLAAEGVSLDGVYSCIHSSDSGCACRKPAPGLARRAAVDFGLVLENTLVVGDKPADMRLARNLGVPGFLVTTGHGGDTLRQGEQLADYVVDDLAQLARICCHPAGLARPAAPPAG